MCLMVQHIVHFNSYRLWNDDVTKSPHKYDFWDFLEKETVLFPKKRNAKMGQKLAKGGYMYMYGRVPLLFTWNYQNIVNQLYHSTKDKVFKKE